MGLFIYFVFLTKQISNSSEFCSLKIVLQETQFCLYIAVIKIVSKNRNPRNPLCYFQALSFDRFLHMCNVLEFYLRFPSDFSLPFPPIPFLPTSLPVTTLLKKARPFLLGNINIQYSSKGTTLHAPPLPMMECRMIPCSTDFHCCMGS